MTDKLKVILCTACTIINGFLGALAIPIYLMVGSSLLDYITGIYAAQYRGKEISSYRGIYGILKKIVMWALVLVGTLLDLILIYFSEALHISFGAGMYISCAVALWITCNEIISILENIKDAGIHVPEWLTGILTHIKSQIDDTAEAKMASQRQSDPSSFYEEKKDTADR